MPKDTTDPRLDEIQHRVDEIRDRAAHDPGFDIVDEDEVPAYFREGGTEGEMSKEEAARRDTGEHHQGHAPG